MEIMTIHQTETYGNQWLLLCSHLLFAIFFHFLIIKIKQHGIQKKARRKTGFFSPSTQKSW
ncbi:MAG: hypothetical protein [Microvirus sp.]|nr:MAG: hypothetical protein [Microvirus sp.]